MNRQPTNPAATWLPVGVVLTATAASVGVLLSIRHQLPERIARHWGASGRPDGFSSFDGILWMQLILGLGVPAVLLLTGHVLKARRDVGAVAAGVSVLLAVGLTLTTWHQRGLSDGALAPDTGFDVLIGMVAGVATGAAVWRLGRGPRPRPTDAPLPADAQHEDLPSGARLVWRGQLRRGWVGVLVLGAVLVSLFPLAFSAFRHQTWGFASLLAASSLALVILSTALYAHVVISSRGVVVRSLGITWKTIPLDAISSASVEVVHGFTQYGGWGLRRGRDGSVGLVTADGDALRLHRPGQGDFVLTVGDADAAATAVNSLIAQRRGEDHA